MSNFLLKGSNIVSESIFLQFFKGSDVFHFKISLVDHLLQVSNLSFIKFFRIILAALDIVKLGKEVGFEFCLEFVNLLLATDFKAVLLIMKIGDLSQQPGKLIFMGILLGSEFKLKILSFVGSLSDHIFRFLLDKCQLFGLGTELISEFVRHFSKGGVFIKKSGVMPEGCVKFAFEIVEDIMSLNV